MPTVQSALTAGTDAAVDCMVLAYPALLKCSPSDRIPAAGPNPTEVRRTKGRKDTGAKRRIRDAVSDCWPRLGRTAGRGMAGVGYATGSRSTNGTGRCSS